ncbi:MAG: hypothetical protein CM1200mP28_09910 [Deltaproteobacteria bacterium]|nr:MAG: hypothetical protein CM1200mP28_09910 [Deltaproteobacteria bacterium]
METKVLEKLKNVQNSVISTGGGIILREYNQSILKQIGKQVYLKVPKKELLQRLKKVKNRPLLKNKDAIQLWKRCSKIEACSMKRLSVS